MTGIAAWLGAAAVRALGSTLRVEVRGLELLRPLWRARRPLIYAVWHGRILMVPWANARLRRSDGARAVTVMASRSRDGDLISAFVRRFGLAAVRGSSSRGGAFALRRLVAIVRAGGDVAVVPDGPRGPRLALQPGVVTLAALTAAPIVPLAFAAYPARHLKSWDEFLVPLPWARAALVLGVPFTVDGDADAERTRTDIERALGEVTAEADRVVVA